MSDELDSRLHAYRPDLADIRLKGKVVASRFVEGIPRQVIHPTAPLRRAPRSDAPLDSEAIFGEIVLVFEETIEGWVWGQIATDSYVGFLPASALGPLTQPSHAVTGLRSFVYPAPDLKMQPQAVLAFGSLVSLGEEVITRGTPYRRVAGGGAIASAHIAPLPRKPEADFVSLAERFLGTPYLWGGRTSFGLDCSGLVQTALAGAGIAAPRDSDLQAKSLGAPLAKDETLLRGDLVFWPGHVGIMQDGERLIHANAFHMEVASEKLVEAVARIGAAGSAGSGIRRLGAPGS